VLHLKRGGDLWPHFQVKRFYTSIYRFSFPWSALNNPVVRIIEAVSRHAEERNLFVEAEIWSVSKVEHIGRGMFLTELVKIQKTQESATVPLGWVKSWIRAAVVSPTEAVFEKNPVEP